MTKINKVTALIKIAEAMEKGEDSKVGKMNRIFNCAIKRESKNGMYNDEIEVTGKEKRLFTC